MKKQYFKIFIIALLLFSCSANRTLVSENKSPREKVSLKAREYFLKGIFLQSKERYSDALVQFHKAQIFDTTSATIHNSLAENYLKLTELEPAIYHLKKAKRLQPDNIESYRLLGEIHLRQRKYFQAIEAYESALKLDPFDDTARNFLFFLYEKTNQPVAKAKLYEGMLDLYGKNKTILTYIAKVYEKQKDFPKALQYLNMILELDSTDAESHYFKGRLLEGLEKKHDAILSYESAIKNSADDTDIVGRLAYLYRTTNQYQKVIDLYEPMFLKNDKNIVARISMAESYYLLNKPDKTKELLVPIENEENIPVGVFDLLGRIELEQKNYPAALGYFNKIITKNKRNRFGWLFMGFTYSDMNDLDKAAETFREAVTYIEDDAAIWSWLGVTLQRQKKFAEAIEPFQKAIAIDPKNTNALSSLPVVLEELDLFAQSDSVYEAGLKTLPDNALLLNNFAYSLSERDQRLQEAFEMSQKAISIEPDNGAYLDTIGWILYKLGKYDEAKDYILKSISLRPKSAVVLDHLGDVYYKLDDIANAKKYWKMSIEVKPDNPAVLDKIANN
ncbi:MAG: tetratricopeptide repeat protein [Calditrichaeota bacterium]|nr:MAG: tetratricopeptide repeat protein [Calditrichota bacterium]MBL1205126.1 tetratricopeptide repeat protein [Calditrichota bacterium]NOG44956.1 tetratricopeptide repeat protein [Calditrichota bacterium]